MFPLFCFGCWTVSPCFTRLSEAWLLCFLCDALGSEHCVERPVSSVIKGSSPMLCWVTCALCDTRHSINQYQIITWYLSRALIGPGGTLSPLVTPTRDSLILGLLERIVCFCSHFGWLCNNTYFRASGIFLKTLFCASHIVIFTL